MSKDKQSEFERNEISEIIAKNFKPNDEQYDPSDFEWSAHCVQMAGYRKQSEWISVEERLPDEQGRFLIVDKEGQMNTAFYSLRFGWFSPVRIKNITHWMPLPEAPKGGAE